MEKRLLPDYRDIIGLEPDLGVENPGKDPL
jgi:hypothetical protein